MPILSDFVEVTLNGSNMAYYRQLGYGNLKRFNTISVAIQHLPKSSNKVVDCSCDGCTTAFSRPYEVLNRDTAKGRVLCNACRYVAAGEAVSNAQTGQKRPSMLGARNPNYNPNRTTFKRYCQEVIKATNRHRHIFSTWQNFDKIGLCGVDGAYQLDHIVSKRYGFENGISPERIGDIQNLQIIPWKINRNKGYKYTEEMIQWHLS